MSNIIKISDAIKSAELGKDYFAIKNLLLQLDFYTKKEEALIQAMDETYEKYITLSRALEDVSNQRYDVNTQLQAMLTDVHESAVLKKMNENEQKTREI